MLHYPHFAFNNIYLTNGYEEKAVSQETVLLFNDEEGLENALRLLLIKKRSALRGWELRFLRRGLKLSQTELAQYFDKDVQTVARIEKSNEVISQPNDLMIRTLYSEKFNLGIQASELLSLIRSPSNEHEYKIYFTFSGVWKHSFIYKLKTNKYQEEFEISLQILNEKKHGPTFITGAHKLRALRTAQAYNFEDDDFETVQVIKFSSRANTRETRSYKYH